MDKMQRISRTETKTLVGRLPEKKIRRPAAGTPVTPFNPQTFLAQVGYGKTMLQISKGHVIFSQGDVADAVFYVRTGRIKLTVLSQHGKDAVVGYSGTGQLLW